MFRYKFMMSTRKSRIGSVNIVAINQEMQADHSGAGEYRMQRLNSPAGTDNVILDEGY